ncbi:MAG TPA: alginate export family protein [Methylophilaceae bacterium]|nr:alginate export family protein [Methylophilaceae bacterium]
MPEYTFLDSVKAGKPMTNFRLRYESVDQDAFQPAPNATKKLDRAEGVTLRSLIGWQTAPFHNFSIAAQVIDVSKFQDDFNDRALNVPQPGHGNYPVIADPDYTGVNQLFVDWTGIRNTKIRAGRQQLNLDNVRYVGDIGFRQVMQVFDGVSVLNKSIPDTEIFLAHFEKVRQINTKLRDTNIELINVKYRISPTESLVGFGYFLDAPNLAQNGGSPTADPLLAGAGNGLGASSDTPTTSTATTDASSRTLGLRLDGVRPINPDWKVLYTAEYAKQDDYKGGSSLIDAHYYRFGGGAMYKTWSLRIDQELLSSNDGRYGFQTPLGTNHLFQGWADLFLVTPRQGIRDTFVTVATTLGKAKFVAEYHDFKSDENFRTIGNKLVDSYGTEFDVGVTYPFTDKLSGKFEYAKFKEDDVYGTSLTAATRKPDTEKIWATLMYTF